MPRKMPVKHKNFKSFFANYGINALSLLELSREIDDIEETGTTFEENAALKAEQISELLQTPCSGGLIPVWSLMHWKDGRDLFGKVRR
ncbi:non-canonical purine NTP pyrophosphatase [Lentibacillus sp. CBA3610]|uniref:non-canonical purine NTP pyrophosphatase n=1 Tax=Lentibacillus sp. CBA3610 TaxID=2518176 RepID=UPI0020D25B8E|nr:non-canonical purine NTP pyrophosphatase [Lentibacillus sp. CBA3610]